MLTTRTSSPYFSPNSASAPLAIASSGPIRWVSTAEFCSTTVLARSSTAAISAAVIGRGWEKSNLSRPGSTSEPFGTHVAQKGSLVEPGRLRFDFSHPRPMTAAEIAAVEDVANTVVLQNSAVETHLMGPDEA